MSDGGRSRTLGTVQEDDLDWVYGAAVQAAASPTSAEQAVKATIRTAPGGAGRRELMAGAVRKALSETPCAALAILPPPQREAVALARILDMGVYEIACVVGCDPREVKARMRAGLRVLAGEPLEASA